MEVIKGNIIENVDQISGSINESSDLISGEITEGAKGFVYYEYSFDVDSSDVWGLYTKHFGNIVSAELINISSYTIDGSSSLPKSIELNTTYIIEITRTDLLLASSIKFKVLPSDYNELQSVVDFESGTGDYLYAISNVSNKVFKYDSNLLKPSNYLGGGSFTVNPLVSTIVLPNIGTVLWFSITYMKDNERILCVGYDSIGRDSYLCYLNRNTDEVTDLDGNLNQTTFYGYGSIGPGTGGWYDYVQNFFYWKTYSGGSASMRKVDLNTNIFSAVTTLMDYVQPKTKHSFNPYTKDFMIIGKVKPEGGYFTSTFYMFNQYVSSSFINIKNNTVYKSNNNSYNRFSHFDADTGYRIGYQSIIGTGNTGYLWVCSFDLDNNVVVGFATSLNYFFINRIDELNAKSFIMQNPEISQTRCDIGEYLKDNIHVGLSNKYGRIHLFDANDPNDGTNPNYGYFDLPELCKDICTNRIV